MNLLEKQQELLNTLSGIKNSQERFAYVVTRGRKSPSLDPSFKTDAYRVEGCLAKLWFVPRYSDGKCFFATDSDSAIVKGIATMLCDFYSGHSPEEIVTIDPSFLEQAGINQHLTPNRRNSLSKIWEQIRAFALAHVVPQEVGKRPS
jgi:cysteine desulfuration protein SufE